MRMYPDIQVSVSGNASTAKDADSRYISDSTQLRDIIPLQVESVYFHLEARAPLTIFKSVNGAQKCG